MLPTTQKQALTGAAWSSIDLEEYGDDALLLFALQLRWGIADIEGVAAEALTDAANDKKCDLLYVNHDAGRIVLGQGQ